MSPDIRLMLGDAIEVMKLMPSSTFDLVIADPPYNLGKDYGNNADAKSFDDYLEFSRNWIEEAHRVLKPTGTLYVFMGFRFVSYIYELIERQRRMHFRNWIVWHYTQGIGKTRGFSPRHDDILMFTKGTDFKFNLDSIRVPQKYYRDRNNMRGANPGDVWEFSHVHYCNENRENHPTQKPEGLMERMVLASSNEGDSVLDPFSGTGTTLRVCQQLGRNCTGIEINPDYLNAASVRLERPFFGFDSVDPRMKRVPLDLNDRDIRENYLAQHESWFLQNHSNALDEFHREIQRVYGHRHRATKGTHQQSLFLDVE